MFLQAFFNEFSYFSQQFGTNRVTPKLAIFSQQCLGQSFGLLSEKFGLLFFPNYLATLRLSLGFSF